MLENQKKEIKNWWKTWWWKRYRHGK